MEKKHQKTTKKLGRLSKVIFSKINMDIEMQPKSVNQWKNTNKIAGIRAAILYIENS